MAEDIGKLGNTNDQDGREMMEMKASLNEIYSKITKTGDTNTKHTGNHH